MMIRLKQAIARTLTGLLRVIKKNGYRNYARMKLFRRKNRWLGNSTLRPLRPIFSIAVL